MNEYTNARDKIADSMIMMMSRLPFYGSLCLHLRFKEDKEEPTMAVTEYGTVYYNPDFVLKLTMEETQFVITHELMHICLKHLERFGDRDRFKANVAADIAVNLLLKDTFTPPRGALIVPRFTNMAFEEIYDQLPDPKECEHDCNQCPFQGKDSTTQQPTSDIPEMIYCKKSRFDKHVTGDDIKRAKNGDTKDVPRGAIEESKNNAVNWDKMLKDAIEYSKQIGKLPAGLERLFGDLVEPKLSWRELLARFIMTSIPSDYTYRRPSRRSITSGYYSPSVKKEGVDVTVCVDTSGSISDTDLRDFMSEVVGILRVYQNVKLKLYSCDTALSDVKEVVSEFDISDVKLHGGGGTDYRPIFNKITEENDVGTKVLIYFGDAYAVFPSEEEVPYWLTVIWVITKNGNPDNVPKFFTNVVHMDDM